VEAGGVTLVEPGLALAWVAIAAGCLVGYQLILQNGRLLQRVEELEQRLNKFVEPTDSDRLPVGTVLHDFDLPLLSGGRMTLSQWRGKRILLLFFDPRCRFSVELLPALAALPRDESAGRPVPLILTTGEAEENRRLMAEHGIEWPVLLQEDREVASLYGVHGTPMACLVDERGQTVAPVAIGGQEVLALARGERSGIASPNHNSGVAAPQPLRNLATRAPVQSRLNRNGLPKGTLAPDFRLPRLDGGELSLAEHQGRQVLLIFSDPACQPCDELAPFLEQLHRTDSHLAVLMVSRGDREANQAKAAQHRLTFPIALQRHWEISREYGMFATPIGYLIDEQGTIAAQVAVGTEAILALASARATATNGSRR
jgi:peroxiredoxin